MSIESLKCNSNDRVFPNISKPAQTLLTKTIEDSYSFEKHCINERRQAYIYTFCINHNAQHNIKKCTSE